MKFFAYKPDLTPFQLIQYSWMCRVYICLAPHSTHHHYSCSSTNRSCDPNIPLNPIRPISISPLCRLHNRLPSRSIFFCQFQSDRLRKNALQNNMVKCLSIAFETVHLASVSYRSVAAESRHSHTSPKHITTNRCKRRRKNVGKSIIIISDPDIHIGECVNM